MNMPFTDAEYHDGEKYTRSQTLGTRHELLSISWDGH